MAVQKRVKANGGNLRGIWGKRFHSRRSVLEIQLYGEAIVQETGGMGVTQSDFIRKGQITIETFLPVSPKYNLPRWRS